MAGIPNRVRDPKGLHKCTSCTPKELVRESREYTLSIPDVRERLIKSQKRKQELLEAKSKINEFR